MMSLFIRSRNRSWAVGLSRKAGACMHPASTLKLKHQTSLAMVSSGEQQSGGAIRPHTSHLTPHYGQRDLCTPHTSLAMVSSGEQQSGGAGGERWCRWRAVESGKGGRERRRNVELRDEDGWCRSRRLLLDKKRLQKGAIRPHTSHLFMCCGIPHLTRDGEQRRAAERWRAAVWWSRWSAVKSGESGGEREGRRRAVESIERRRHRRSSGGVNSTTLPYQLTGAELIRSATEAENSMVSGRNQAMLRSNGRPQPAGDWTLLV